MQCGCDARKTNTKRRGAARLKAKSLRINTNWISSRKKENFHEARHRSQREVERKEEKQDN